MAELADALGSGLSVRKDMGVQIPLRPPLKGILLERRGRRDAIIILIVMIIIAAVIASWLTGLWSCDTGRKDLTEEERLTIADYINSISVLVQHSNKLSINFFTALNKINNTSREEIDTELSRIIEESKVILENIQEMNPPEFFEVSHGYLELVFDMRNKAYEDFKPAFFNVLQELDPEKSTEQIADSFKYMYMSDEVYRYFQEELKNAGDELGVSNLTIIDSTILEDDGLADVDSVAGLISTKTSFAVKMVSSSDLIIKGGDPTYPLASRMLS